MFDETNLVFIFTAIYAIVFTYGLLKISIVGTTAIFIKENRFKNIILYFGYFVLLCSPGYLLPDNLQQSIIYGISISFGMIVLWLYIKRSLKEKHDCGELLFKSDRFYYVAFLYLSIFVLIVAVAFIIFRSMAIISNPQEQIQEVFDIRIDYRIYYFIVMLGMLNAVFVLIAMTWLKLEIRQQGIIFLNSLIRWKDIVGYSWISRNKDLLEIEYVTRQDKTSKCKIAILIREKKV